MLGIASAPWSPTQLMDSTEISLTLREHTRWKLPVALAFIIGQALDAPVTRPPILARMPS